MKIIDKVLFQISDSDFINGELILNEVVEIKESVFENNQILRKLKAPNLKKIGNSTFKSSTLVEFEAPLLEEIGDNAFENTSISSIVLPKSLKKLGKYAFTNNKYLQKVQIEALMTKIKNGMFENCINLKEVKLSKTINKLGTNVFKNCRKLNNIELPEHLKIIEKNCFWECRSLKKININSELEFINDYAFGYTKIDNIILGENIKNIGILPFYMCSNLEKVKINSLFNDEIFDSTTPKLKEITIGTEQFELLKPIRKIINFNNLIIVRYIDESFQLLSKKSRYYDIDYFNKIFPLYDNKKIIKNDNILNIFYWGTILGEKNLEKLNPISFIALPANSNIIKAYYHNHDFYDEIISKNNLRDFNQILAMIKFVTIFGGLKRNKANNIELFITKIGIRNITDGFLNTEVKEFNQKFLKIYCELSLKYSYAEINKLMPSLYNNIEKINGAVENIEENDQICEINILRTNSKVANYEWLDTTSVANLLWGYVLASVAGKSIDASDDMRKVLSYNIVDKEGLIIAKSQAYYSSNEKYLLFNSIILSQSFINKEYTVEKIKNAIIKYVLEGIEDIINFFNERELIITKVHVGISEKSINEQLTNKRTQIIKENI